MSEVLAEEALNRRYFLPYPETRSEPVVKIQNVGYPRAFRNKAGESWSRFGNTVLLVCTLAKRFDEPVGHRFIFGNPLHSWLSSRSTQKIGLFIRRH